MIMIIITQSHSLQCSHGLMCKVNILVVGLWPLLTVCKASPQGSPTHLTLGRFFDQCQKAQSFVFFSVAEPRYTFASPQVWP